MNINIKLSKLSHRCPAALGFADDNTYNKELLYLYTSICFAYIRSLKIADKQPISMIKIQSIYCCDTSVQPLQKLYFHNQVFLLSCLCTDTFLRLTL